MITADRLITACWLAFFAYWLISAVGTKNRTPTSARWIGVAFRAALIVIAVVLPRLPVFRQLFQPTGIFPIAPPTEFVRDVGAALCVAGIALAIWARARLGRNWGMPMSLKQDTQLVTTGPYSVVRHPIYTGVLLALTGTALAEGIAWFLGVIVMAPYFAYSAKVEERNMAERLPGEYPAYKARTKMIVPFLF